MYYAHIKNDIFLGVSECRLLGDDTQNAEISETLFDDALKFHDKYEWNGKELVECADYVEKMLSKLRTEALSRIDSATSTAILQGFEHEVKLSTGNEVLYFSYDSFDQQNFADTANGAMMQMMAIPTSLPTVIEWNGWRNHTAESKGELVKVPLKADQFISLYTEGALAHKAYQMEIGTLRKQEIEACLTVEEINALLSEWGI